MFIRDEATGQTYGFGETDSEYRRAAEKIHELQKQGHDAGGDAKKVLDYTHQSRYDTGFLFWG